LSNETNGKSLVVNISGPGFVNPDGTELVLTGTSLLFGFTSPHGLFLTRGPDIIDLTTSNTVITSAATVDLCAALS
jgi:hypothetical protein